MEEEEEGTKVMVRFRGNFVELCGAEVEARDMRPGLVR